MATQGLKDTTAELDYQIPSAATVTHTLAYPFLELERVEVQPRFVFESADLSARHIVTIGAGVQDLWATIRFENEPDELLTLLRAGLHEGATLTYRPAASGPEYECTLVDVEGGEVALRPDRVRHGYGEWECRIRLRGDFDGLLDT